MSCFMYNAIFFYNPPGKVDLIFFDRFQANPISSHTQLMLINNLRLHFCKIGIYIGVFPIPMYRPVIFSSYLQANHEKVSIILPLSTVSIFSRLG